MEEKSHQDRPQTNHQVVPLKTPFARRTLTQHFGCALSVVGGLLAVIGLWSVYDFVMALFDGEFDLNRLLLILTVILIGIPLNSLGQWLLAPKVHRGKFKLFYDPPHIRKRRGQKDSDS